MCSAPGGGEQWWVSSTLMDATRMRDVWEMENCCVIFVVWEEKSAGVKLAGRSQASTVKESLISH